MPVMQHAPVLDLYQALVDITGAMLAAAQEEDWDAVARLGRRYCDEVERLRELESAAPMDEAGRARKHALLVRILENDAAVRDLAMPQLMRLGDLLGRMKRQQQLLAAYGRGPGG